ncbi:MAG: sialate O-acetylesterase, partial [Terrimicrobiaceae bacterium]|nr:sialate O-acetylesterase [Terrimicrobiaceae bacterium]
MRLNIARDKVRKGANEPPIRVESPGGPARLRVSADNFRFGEHMLEGDLGSAAGIRAARTGRAGAQQHAPAAAGSPFSIQGRPSRLYQGMIAPLILYGLAGVIWYQGESNASR